MKEKIKWSWKLRIRKNSSKIHRNKEVIRDLKNRLENLEIEVERVNFNTTNHLNSIYTTIFERLPDATGKEVER